ncbi:MAG: prolyl oligopeptidase family serine peptidase [Gemmatimonadaceae bacterium]
MRLAFPVLLVALPAAAASQTRPAITAADYGKFESLGSAVLSPDGRWIAYSVSRVDEQSELRLRRLDRDTSIVVPNGTTPVFDASSRWLAYTITVSPDERERLERDKKPVRTSVGLVDLGTLAHVTLAQATSFRFSGDAQFLAARLHPQEAAKRDAAELLVRELASGVTRTFGNVAAFSWTEAGALLAMTLETEGAAGNGVQLVDAASGTVRTLASSSDRYRGLAWRQRSTDLAVLQSQATPGYRDTTNVVLAWRNAGAPNAVRITLDPAVASLVPAGMRIAEQRTPEWSRDGLGLALGLRPRVVGSDSSAKAATKDKPSDVQIWHARDMRPIPQQKAQEQADLRRTLYALWRLDEQRLVQVGTALQEQVMTAEGSSVALETSAERYAFGQMFGRRQTDVDVIDLRTGQRRRLIDGARFLPTLSPTGRHVAHFRDGHWWVTATATGSVVNASAIARATFANRDDDHPGDEPGSWGSAGWSSDGRWFYVYDKYDVWRLTSDASRADRLTNGAEQRRVHRLVRLEPLDERARGIDASRPIHVSVTGEWSKESGFARILPGHTAQQLVLTPANTWRLMKADSAATLAFVRERFDESPNWYVGAGDLRDARRVSELNPFLSHHAWGKSELVEFTSDSGRRLQGALYYPANYDPSRKYPMIVNTYEILSNAVHAFVPPSQRTYYNRTVWTSQGYFVFTPDIVFRPGDPGRSYMECLVPAVRSVIARGVVDSARIGLIGHSWGGYEATYAPTQTTLFATSIAGAPITNFLSFAGAFHWTPGFPEFDHWETGQARMAKPPWEDFEGHVRNSPAAFVHKLQRPMLMVFGDADGTVDWHQGVEFYNFARRAGKEDFVMLVYPGEDHGLRKKENQIDYHRRILEWFGHWLRGEPAAEWIRRGVTWQERKAVVEGGK